MSSNGRGIQIEYPSITLHAISRADNKPSIYCQLDEHVASTEEAQGEEDEANEMRELVIVPQASNTRESLIVYFTGLDASQSLISVDDIFEALSLCASLHPDPADEDDMDDDDDTFIDMDNSAFETFNGDAGEELSEVGRVRSNFVNDNRYAPY